MKTIDEIRAILDQVNDRLIVHARNTGVALHVEPDGYLHDDPWLSVVISPDKPGMRAYDYVEALGEVQRDLRQAGVDHVVLVPALAD